MYKQCLYVHSHMQCPWLAHAVRLLTIHTPPEFPRNLNMHDPRIFLHVSFFSRFEFAYLASPSAVCSSSGESAPPHHEADWSDINPGNSSIFSLVVPGKASIFSLVVHKNPGFQAFHPGGSQKSWKLKHFHPGGSPKSWLQHFQLGGTPNKPSTCQPTSIQILPVWHTGIIYVRISVPMVKPLAGP